MSQARCSFLLPRVGENETLTLSWVYFKKYPVSLEVMQKPVLQVVLSVSISYTLYQLLTHARTPKLVVQPIVRLHEATLHRLSLTIPTPASKVRLVETSCCWGLHRKLPEYFESITWKLGGEEFIQQLMPPFI